MTEESTTPDTEATSEEEEQTAEVETKVSDEQDSEAVEAEAGDDQETPDDSVIKKARKEAAGYRERLRKTETERDTATGLVSSLRKQIIDGQVAEMGMKPAALWATGFSVGDLLNDEGLIDSTRVASAAAEAREILGLSKFGGGADGGKRGGTPEKPAAEWADLLDPR